MKVLGLLGVLLVLGPCLVGCSGDTVKPEESMEGTMKEAQKNNPGGPKGGSKRSGGGLKVDTANENAPQGTNSPQ